MAVQELNDWVTPTLTVTPFDGTTGATLVVTAPDGTSAPAVSGSGGGQTWTGASYQLTQPGQWSEQWTVTGTGKGQETRVILVFPTALGRLSDPYVSLDLLRHRLGINDSEDDYRMLQAAAATAYGIEQVCGRQFNRSLTATARVYAADSRCEPLEVDDFYSITGLVVATDDNDDGVFETVWVAADYQLLPLNGIVNGRPGWPFETIVPVASRRWPTRRRAGVQLTAPWGWAAVPWPVMEANQIVAEDIFKLNTAPFGVAGFGEFGAVRVRQNSFAMNMLKPFRRYPVVFA